jgi:hypothetical protein
MSEISTIHPIDYSNVDGRSLEPQYESDPGWRVMIREHGIGLISGEMNLDREALGPRERGYFIVQREHDGTYQVRLHVSGVDYSECISSNLPDIDTGLTVASACVEVMNR